MRINYHIIHHHSVIDLGWINKRHYFSIRGCCVVTTMTKPQALVVASFYNNGKALSGVIFSDDMKM